MKPFLFGTYLLLAVPAVSGHDWNATCTTRSQRPAWSSLSDEEKAVYIEAELCLMAAAPQTDIEGALNRWDELHWSHISQTNVIHGVGAFLPWHRYFVRVHEYLLQSECGYEGGQPYWDEPADVADLAGSVLFDPETGFGGPGTPCITDGPFVDLVLHFDGTSTSAEYCLYRQFNTRGFSAAAQSNVDRCLAMTTYETARNCFEGSPHNAGHGGVGGLMVNVQTSPGDPIFHLHHAYLDKIWWEWQVLDLEARLVEMSGQNTPGRPTLELLNVQAPSEEILAENGDPGNVTTLNHILGMVGIVPDAIISEVMDIRGDLICAEYL